MTASSSAALGALPAVSETMFYDALGRACYSSESLGTPGTAGSVSPGLFSYTYNLAGGISTETYPSGRALTTTYDFLNRPVGVTASTTYANLNGTSYASNDALAQLQSGPSNATLATQAFTYDSIRQQPMEIRTTNGGGTAAALHCRP